MWFLTKCAFWLTVVLLVLPIPDSERRHDVHYVSPGEAVSVLSAALTDARGFCTRNPEACATGAHAAQSLGHRAQVGARMLSDFIDQQLAETRHVSVPAGSRQVSQAMPGAATPGAAPPASAPPAASAPGSRAPASAPPTAPTARTSSVDTLTPTDRAAPWGGPDAQRRG